MSIGAGIFLAAVGAILSFAVQDSIAGVDLTVIGYILIGAGVLMLVLGLAFRMKSQKVISTKRTAKDPVSGEGVSQVEQSIG